MSEVLNTHLPEWQVTRATVPRMPGIAPLTFADSVSDKGENIAYGLLKRNQKILTEYQADLFGSDFVILFIEVKHFENKVVIGFKVVRLGSLPGVDDVLQNQRMDIKMSTDFLDQLDVVDTVNVQPCGCR